LIGWEHSPTEVKPGGSWSIDQRHDSSLFALRVCTRPNRHSPPPLFQLMQTAREGGLWAHLWQGQNSALALLLDSRGRRDCVSGEQRCRPWLALIPPEVAPFYSAANIETPSTNDNRSYHVSSRKIFERLRYRPLRTIQDAVRDLCHGFRADKFKDSMTNDDYVNVKTVKKLSLQ